MGISPTQDDESAVLRLLKQKDEAWAVSHTLSEIHSIISLPDSPSRWSLTPAVIPTHCLFSFFPPFQSLSFDAHTDFLYCLRLAHGARWIESRLEKKGRGIWVRIEVLSQLRQRKNKPCLFYPVLPSLILHMYTHRHTHTHACYQAWTGSDGSGRQLNLLSMFVAPPYS